MRKLDLSGRLANWVIELGEFDIEFHPRNTIKGQALADFLAEFTNLLESEDLPHTRAGVMLITPDGEELCSSLKLEIKTTNNEAKYEVVIVGLRLAQEMGAEFVELWSDSQVITGHI
jgi:hypothetical protein